ncbi:MAG TPA: tRNA (adenosine(37)-N6)-threonylcarbamoyltransferase complex dimerization subunit type 1 TsaB [Terriglobales bacterium]|jgi:tRNA threonylcarbamoyladenosine biosynthesis protein TsaB|nr:tRNA (adenosine(37)-N6)-threonylcarbamoyltransferase complex dimerization subunit type 1 TsaB [Terriglobales bacterium]
MLLLAVDTSGRQGGITLARGNGDQVEIIESASIQGGTFSAELIPQISDLLRRRQLTPGHLQGLVAVTGPGSFTGLRVGLTAVKGLAEVLKIPIAAVTSLELLLAASATQKGMLAVLDAGRGEVYAAIQNGLREEMLLSLEEAVGLAKSRNLHVLVAEPNIAAKFDHAKLVTYRSTETAARTGNSKLVAGETVDVLALDANYIRRSEAEYMQKMRR